RLYDNKDLTNIKSGDTWTLIEHDGKVSQVKIKKSASRGYSGDEPPSEEYSEISTSVNNSSVYSLIKGLKISQDKIKFYHVQTPPSAKDPIIGIVDGTTIKYGDKGEKLVFNADYSPKKLKSSDDSVDYFRLTVKFGEETQTLIDAKGSRF